MRQKFISIFLFALLLTGCNIDNTVPAKYVSNSAIAYDSPINCDNIDDYLFREDSFYVDVRPLSWIYRDGHISGFSFFPFYGFICQYEEEDGLFTMSQRTVDENIIEGGTPGSFMPKYIESETIIKNIFPKDKYIFVLSSSGFESIYLINLLIQLDYDASKLYNIGGFSISPGNNFPAYTYKERKYFVKGNSITNYTFDSYDFSTNFTPIERSE